MRTFSLNLAVLVFLLAGNASIGIAQPTGTFTPTGDMSFRRAFHTATLLANGKVLIVGGVAAGPSSNAELYDADSGTFIPARNMTAPRTSPTATLLNDGRVLIVGGNYMSGAWQKNSAELYDPTTGTFTETGGTVTNQIGGFAILLNNGKVLVAGGVSAFPLNPPAPIANPELYDPSTGAFTSTGAFATTGGSFYVTSGPDISAVSLLSDGRVLIAGEPNSELYDPVSGTFSLTGPMATPCLIGGGTPPIYISGRTATLLTNDKVLLTGGEEEDCGRFSNAELYDPGTEKFVLAGNMIRARDNQTATLMPDGTVLVSGGETQDCDGRGFCIFSGTSTTVEAFDPATGSFQTVGNMNVRRSGHTATLLMNGTVLLDGGYGYGGIGLLDGLFSSAEIYSPPVPLPTPVVTDLRFDRTTVAIGESFTANFSGSSITPEMFFDVRFTAPGSTFSDVSFNWQKGPTSSHLVSAGIAPGVWMINGVRAHRFESDHTGNFHPVTASIAVGK
jgi:hypothetical protein